MGYMHDILPFSLKKTTHFRKKMCKIHPFPLRFKPRKRRHVINTGQPWHDRVHSGDRPGKPPGTKALPGNLRLRWQVR